MRRIQNKLRNQGAVEMEAEEQEQEDDDSEDESEEEEDEDEEEEDLVVEPYESNRQGDINN